MTIMRTMTMMIPGDSGEELDDPADQDFMGDDAPAWR
jgi:hypothetical protein